MTAFVIGKTTAGTFAVIDSMVQTGNTISYRDCRLQDKITEIRSSNQYLLLCGEEIIARGAEFIDNWYRMNNAQLDLFNRDNFMKLLKTCNKYRRYTVEIHNATLIDQNSTVYIIDAHKICCYEVFLDNNQYELNPSINSVFQNNHQELIYNGNRRSIELGNDINTIIESSKDALEREHDNRRIENTQLNYDFEDRFSSILFHQGKLIKRTYPFERLTEQFLCYGANWDFIEDVSFQYSPSIE